ncbi:UNKNOWN [Stylonychia lemnae]|uniref:Uncharacterized protein n=1 Tax=Stylonychia lemnae TaxID=5949 RepID=A0A078A0Q7_STYLE|nr:UNKNOWN [Stylonychia lemnae]|eukprot:CDW75038.1 UNKNOWN [Stylonychia lemnae]
MVFLQTFSSDLQCQKSGKVIPLITNNSINESQRSNYGFSHFDLNILLWLLFAYHAIESFSNINELIQIRESQFKPIASMLFSINGCYGLGVFVYAQVLLFGYLSDCKLNTLENQLLHLWIVVEITTKTSIPSLQ